jgi:CubicO group peptidase (beta-lactamase class C family)
MTSTLRRATPALLAVFLAATPAGADAKDLARKIDAVVAPYAEHDLFAGVVLLARGDRILAERAYGLANTEFGVPVTPTTRFPIASITKRFTLLVLHRLADEEKLAMADPLAKWVPSFPSAEAITIEQLVTHRSGVRDPDDLRGTIRTNFTTAEVVAHLAKQPLASAPGAEYSYTTANYAILAHVIERATGESFAAAMERYIYGPAGMRDSGELTTTTVVPRLASSYMPDLFGRGLAVCGPEDTSWKAGGGSSYSTARDLHRFFRALYGGRLSSVPASELFATSPLLDQPAFRSSGSFPGANAHALYLPGMEVTVVVLSNNYAPMVGSIAEKVAAIHLGKPYDIPRAPRTIPVGALDSRLPGSYRVEGIRHPFRVEVRDGTPLVTWTPSRQSAFLRVDERTWFLPLDWAVLKFEPDHRRGVWTAPWADHPLEVTKIEE